MAEGEIDTYLGHLGGESFRDVVEGGRGGAEFEVEVELEGLGLLLSPREGAKRGVKDRGFER